MFKDKKYESMDDASKLFEPFEFKLNDELAKLPDRIELTPEVFLEHPNLWGNGFNMSCHDVVVEKARSLSLGSIWRHIPLLSKNNFFKFEVENLNKNDKVELHATNGTLSHKVYVVKNKIAFDEHFLENHRKEQFNIKIDRAFSRNRYMNKKRFNEIADIYGANEVKHERAFRRKLSLFIKHITNMMDDKTLDIRDWELCEKFNDWIIRYVKDGNLACLNNLTRIKIMTHEKRPIYSIEEKE